MFITFLEADEKGGLTLICGTFDESVSCLDESVPSLLSSILNYIYLIQMVMVIVGHRQNCSIEFNFGGVIQVGGGTSIANI